MMFIIMNEQPELRARAPWEPPEGRGLAVVGDIHGRVDRLNRLLTQLPRERTLIFLGDYIDRGPDSRGVIDRLLRLSHQRDCVFLCGNHEDMLLAVLDNMYEGAAADWMRNGGDATLRSYGVASVQRLTEELPEEHVSFLRGLCEHKETKEFVFVHAGISPDGPDATDRDTKLWMRIGPNEAFGYGKIVIYGHTPYRSPLRGPDWINIDTGCGKLASAPLTGLLLPEFEVVQG
jgi:diadenosine tetraphosphatase ApaH/serine/threonine PP2A family protein phosphatase